MQAEFAEQVHLIIEAGSAIGTAFLIYLTSALRLSQLRTKLDLDKHNSELKEEFVNRYNQIASDLRDHKTEDRMEFKSIKDAHERIEAKIDKIDKKT
jgi:hypothetical protein